MDISTTTAPKSDQQNFDDYIAGPKTVTVSEVRAGTPEQPVEIHLVEYPGRPFKPSKTARRVLVAAWGADASEYAGRRMTLYGDPTVKFGGATVGGIRISALSHIEKPLTLSLTTTRGKRAPVTIQPLAQTVAPLEQHLDALNTATTLPALQAAWQAAGQAGVAGNPQVIAAKDARKAELAKAVDQ